MSKLKLAFIVLTSVATAVVLLLVAYQYYPSLNNDEAGINNDPLQSYLEVINDSEELGGELYLTTLEKISGVTDVNDTSENYYPLETYELTLPDGEVTQRIQNSLPNLPIQFVVEHEEKGSSSFVSFVEERSTSSTQYPDFHIFSQENESAPLYILSRRELESGVGNHVVDRRLPTITKDGEAVLYNAREVANFTDPWPDPSVPNNWNIYVYDQNAPLSPDFYTTGYDAEWVLDGEYVIFTKNDGVYMAPYQKGKDSFEELELFHVLKDEQGRYSTQNTIAVSPDGAHVAINYPKKALDAQSEVGLYKVVVRDGLPSLDLLHIIYTQESYSLWPTFSPDGRYLALQTNQVDNQEGNGQIVVYDFVSRSGVKTISIGQFYFESLFTTDWVQ